VICFMSKKYQQSENCKLELKFAKQTGVPIVPVMMESGWKPSDWLGVITAGALWTPFEDDNLAQNINNLVGQIQSVVGVRTEILESVNEMREELERLRDDDKKPVTLSLSDNDECALPHVIPEASSALVVSDSMHTLVQSVVSPQSKRHCGFWGSGGSEYLALTSVSRVLTVS
jgi:hypothetical protein